MRLPSSDSSGARDPLERLGEEFVERWRRGERPTVEEYAAAHPELADGIRSLFPGMLEMEGLRGSGRATRLAGAEEAGDAVRPAGLPTSIGPYRIERELGRGGMGVVYLAEDTRLHRRVALKVLPPEVASSRDLRRRFEREAAVASRLDHPGICTVYEAGEEQGTGFIAMRYVEGESLDRWVARRSERLRDTMGDVRTREGVLRVVAVIEEAARALHAAHEAGLIHRDIKPANVMVTEAGEPVLLDFGLARETEEAGPALTLSGALMGTPLYMSPEQIAAERGRVDRRTDVYSLGVTLYECLTGRPPFEAPTREALYRRILETEAEDPRRLNRSLPDDLRVVVETAMEKDRERRYRTAEAFAEDLRRVREREPILARPAGPWLRLRRWSERNPAVAGSVAALFLSLSAGLAVSLHLLDETRTERDAKDTALGERGVALEEARRERSAAEEARARAEADRDAKAIALRSARAQALVGASAGARRVDPMRALLLAREAVRVDATPGTVSRLHEAIGDSRERSRFDLLPGQFPAGQASVTRGGTHILLFREGRDSAMVVDAASRTHTLFQAPEGTRLAGVRFVPRSGGLLGATDTGVLVWGRDGALHRTIPGAVLGEQRGLRTADTAAVDERLLTVDPVRGRIRVVDYLGNDLGGFEVAEPRPESAVLSPTGTHVLVASASGMRDQMVLWEAAGGRPIWLAGHEDHARLGGFSPRGTLAWTVALDGSVRVWDLRGRLRTTVHLREDMAVEVKFMPDDESFLTLGLVGGVRRWDSSGAEIARFVSSRRETLLLPMLLHVAISPDGGRVLTCEPDGCVLLWDADGNELAVLGDAGTTGFMGFTPVHAAFSGDGSSIRLAAADGSIRTCDVGGGEVAAVEGNASPKLLVRRERDEATRTLRMGLETPPSPQWDVTRGGDRFLVHEGDGFARMFDADGRDVGSLRLPVGQRWESVEFLGAGDRVLAGSATGHVALDLAGQRVPWADAHATPWVRRLCPRGAGYLVPGPDGKAHRIDEDGRDGGALDVGRLVPTDGAVSSDGRIALALAARDDSASLLEFRDASGTALGATPLSGIKQAVVGIAVAPDGKRFATSSMDGALRMWDFDGHLLWEHGEGEHEFNLRAMAFDICFTPEGSRILAGWREGMARLLDSQGHLLRTFGGHDGPVTDVALSPDGSIVATGAMDGTVRLSDIDGPERATLRGHRGAITGLAFLAGGRRLLSVSLDQTARVWCVETDDLLRLADERCLRDFTDAERARYGDLIERR